MPSLETITEADLNRHLRPVTLSRARGYLDRVRHPVREGETLAAEVVGTYVYHVEVAVRPDGIEAHCTCPYDWGGYCKHIGALILKWIHSPGAFIVEGVAPAPRSDRNSLRVEFTPIEPPATWQPEELPFWLVIPYEVRQFAHERYLMKLAADISIQDLRSLAEARGWKARGIRKDPVVQQVVEHLTDSEETMRALGGLDDEHRRVLCALVLLGETLQPVPELIRSLATLWGPLRAHERVKTYTRHLCELGLAIPGDVAPETMHDYVPRSLSRCLPRVFGHQLGLWPPAWSRREVTAAGEEDSELAELQLADPHSFVKAVNQIILLLERDRVPLRSPMARPTLEASYPILEEWDYDREELLQAARENEFYSRSGLTLTVPAPGYVLPDEAIDRLAPLAGGEERLDFIISLLTAGGVFQPGSPVTVWPEVKRAFFQHRPLMQRAILAHTYFRVGSWNVLWMMLRQQPAEVMLRRYTTSRGFRPEHLEAYLASFRWMVLGTLASFPDEEWIALGEVDKLMSVLWPRLDYTPWQGHGLPAHNMYWFLSEPGEDVPLDSERSEHWQLAQGRFIRTMISGPLHWLGLADLRFDGRELLAVRFFGLGDLFWDTTEAPPVPPHSAWHGQATSVEGIVVGEDRTIRVQPSAVSGQAHALLGRIAQLVTTDPDCFEYRLDVRATHETFEAGTTLLEILDDWDRLLPDPMPDAVEAQLRDWWDAHGRLRIHQDVTVIEFGDDYALAEMKATTSLEEHLITEISPRLVVIPREAVERLANELEDAGHMPRISATVETGQEAW